MRRRADARADFADAAFFRADVTASWSRHAKASSASRSTWRSASTSDARDGGGVAFADRDDRGVRRRDRGGVDAPAAASADRGGVCVPRDDLGVFRRDRGGVVASGVVALRGGVAARFGGVDAARFGGVDAFFKIAARPQGDDPLGTLAKGLRGLSGVPRGMVYDATRDHRCVNKRLTPTQALDQRYGVAARGLERRDEVGQRLNKLRLNKLNETNDY